MIFRFAFPWAFALLPLVVLAAWRMARRRARVDAHMPLPRASQRFSLGSSPWVRLERALPWLRGIALVLVVVAIARPQAGAKEERRSTHGVDIVVALDISGSMRAMDFEPDRLTVARDTVSAFVEGRPSDRIGLVAFAALATTRSPLTLDHDMFQELLDQVTFAPPEEDGTALGMGLAAATNRLRKSQARSKVVVLVTDGRNNRGQIGPEAAAEAARALGVRVYTVGVGSEGMAPVPVDDGRLGRRYVMQELDLDEELLIDIADRTDGQYFRATDPDGLRVIFETIDQLETTEIESHVRVLYDERFLDALLPAVGLLLLEGMLVATRLRRVP
jgi:Ca-activated chloride channel family protein